MKAPLLLLTCALIGGCSRGEPDPRPEPSPERAVPPSPRPAGPLVLAPGVRLVPAPAGADASRVVREERERARADGRELVVYVGAKWCEPCRYFHEAAQRGELDGQFPALTLLEFDLDADRDRLASAGYASELIPLFVIPGADGRASGKKLEGSVKGAAAVSNIAPRLHALLGG